MATALIPEVIQPGVLYAPSVTNRFSAPFATAMPNTDVGMQVLGAAGGGAYRAYQPAISGIHYPAAGVDPFCLLFWQYSTGGNSSATTTLAPLATIVSVMDATASSSNTGLVSSTVGFRWWLGGTNVPNFPRAYKWQVAVGASSRAGVAQNNFNIANSAWTSMAFRKDASAVPTIDDFALNSISAGGASAGTPGTPGAVTSPYFALGPYSLTAGWGSDQQNRVLAKISLFDYFVTNAELLDLLDSMTNGPPSP